MLPSEPGSTMELLPPGAVAAARVDAAAFVGLALGCRAVPAVWVDTAALIYLGRCAGLAVRVDAATDLGPSTYEPAPELAEQARS